MTFRLSAQARQVVPWSALLLVLALALGGLVNVHAQGGTSAADAIPIGTDGRFSGVVPANNASLWFRFSYAAGPPVTISVTYLPADNSTTDLFVYTGDPNNPRRESTTATRSGNTLAQTFVDTNPRNVFIQFQNESPSVVTSFVGNIAPTAGIATPSPVTVTPVATVTTPTPGPVADAPSAAITLGADGSFVGTIAPRHPVWYRFYYGNPGANASVSVTLAPAADAGDLNVYTGDSASLAQQGGAPLRSGNTLSRTINLPNAQFVFFTVANNSDATVLAYSGMATPAYAPPTTPTATTTGTARPTTTAVPAPTNTPQAAPAMVHDNRYFSQTGYRVDNDQMYAYFLARGQIDAFGYPVSRTFLLFGCQVQIFQRQVAQVCPGASVALMNLLDPEIFPYTSVNGSTFPAPDVNLKNSTPLVGSPTYGSDILSFVRANAPDVFQNQQVDFGKTFFGTVSEQQGNTSDPNILGLLDLEIWGAPISQPMRDPNNADFVYQRFQRGIMHRIVSQSATRGILLADYLKAIIRGAGLPADLQGQAQGNRFYAQYCPGAQGWVCRPSELTGTDLTFAFESG